MLSAPPACIERTMPGACSGAVSEKDSGGQTGRGPSTSPPTMNTRGPRSRPAVISCFSC